MRRLLNEISGQTNSYLRRKQNLWIAGLVALCGIVLCVLWWRSDSLFRHIESPAPASPPRQGGAALAHPAAGAQTAASTVAPGPFRPATTIIQPPPSSSRDDSIWRAFQTKVEAFLKERIDICGLSPIEVAYLVAGDGVEIMGRGHAAIAEVADRHIQSDKPGERALGLYVQAALAKSEAREAEIIGYRQCKDDIECRYKLFAASQQVNVIAVEPLVTLALSSRDPGIYAAALYACNGISKGSCAYISATVWTTIEPDNAAAWARVASEAHAVKNTFARDEALRGMMAAGRYDARIPSLGSIFVDSTAMVESPMMQIVVGATLAGSNSMASMTASAPLSGLCLGREPMDEARKPFCDKLARSILDKDESIAGLSVVTEVGRKVGWDTAQLRALDDEKTLGMGLALEGFDAKTIFGCDALPKTMRKTYQSITKGERSFAREHVAASGKTIGELAEKYRKSVPGFIK